VAKTIPETDILKKPYKAQIVRFEALAQLTMDVNLGRYEIQLKKVLFLQIGSCQV